MQLHITNGDSAAALLEAGGCTGTILPWQDVLHEGPVPALGLRALSAVRVDFLAHRGWGTRPELHAQFGLRDRTIEGFSAYSEVVLWFEHDLYDQLQLVQILSFLARQDLSNTPVTLVCIDRHEAVEAFRGLGDLQPGHIAPLFQGRAEVPKSTYDTAVAAWDAFTGKDLKAVVAFLAMDSSALPFMRAALARWLQELPSTFNGLGRTPHHVLRMAAGDCSSAVDLLKAHWDQEQVFFMGDWSFWNVIGTLATAPTPLVTVTGARSARDMRAATVSVTAMGHRVLAGECDAVELRGIDCWFGGTHLNGHRAHFRWDAASGTVMSDPAF